MSEVMEKLGITHDQWDYHKDSYESVIWKGDPACTKTEWDNAVKAVENDYKNTQYQRDRADAYPSWQDQMDLLYHGGVDALKAELKKTKDKYPKPT